MSQQHLLVEQLMRRKGELFTLWKVRVESYLRVTFEVDMQDPKSLAWASFKLSHQPHKLKLLQQIVSMVVKEMMQHKKVFDSYCDRKIKEYEQLCALELLARDNEELAAVAVVARTISNAADMSPEFM